VRTGAAIFAVVEFPRRGVLSRRYRVNGGALALAVCLLVPADLVRAQSDLTSLMPEGQARPTGALTFDIPAQSLAAALEQYGSLTGRDAIYKSSLMVGRRSTAVRGQLSPDEALAVLLQGTGLSVAHATSKSFVLLPAAVSVAAAPPVAPPYAVSQYYGRIQAGLQKVLCAESEARPGRYRLAVRLWFDAGGNVAKYERWDSTGAAWRDEMIDRALRRMRIDMPPPAGLVQPVSIVIRPQAPGVTMGCGEVAIRHAGTAR
jgi:hypothetical protein